MPVIRISDAVYRELQKHAEPLQDTADDVLRRLLHLQKTSAPPRQQSTNRTSEAAFREPILIALLKMGGHGKVAEVLDTVRQIMAPRLTPQDQEILKGGDPRWRNTAAWERKRLVEEGLIYSDHSHYGVWELTPKGFNKAQKLQQI